MWVPVWFESNLILEKDYDYRDEYFKTLNRIFNTTISYRSDSWIPNRFYSKDVYSKDYARHKEIYYNKRRTPLISDEAWSDYESNVLKKTK